MQNSSFIQALSIATPYRHRDNPVRVEGRFLLILRATWILFALLFLGIFIIAVPVEYAGLSHPTKDILAELTQAHLSVHTYAAYTIILEVFYVLGYCLTALVIFWRRSDEVIGLYVSFFLLTFGIASAPIVYALPQASSFWTVPVSAINAIGWGCFAPFFYLFPDGRFVPRWTRWLAIVSFLYQAFWIVPTSSPAYTGNWPTWLFICVELSLGVSCLVAPIYRYLRISTRLQRQQTKWVLFSIIVLICVYGMSIIVGRIAPTLAVPNIPAVSLFLPWLLPCVYLLAPLSILVAILRYHLWDIDIIINRTLMYITLSACVIGLYTLVVVTLSTLFQAQSNILISLFATAIIALCFQPLRERLQKILNRLMFGERDNPYTVLATLGRRLETTLAPEDVLPAIVETVAHSLKLPYVAIRLKQEGTFTLAVSYQAPSHKEKFGSSDSFLLETDESLHPLKGTGRPQGSPLHGVTDENVGESLAVSLHFHQLLHVPLTYQIEEIGELVLAPRASGESFTTAERQLLVELARQAGIAVHGVLVTADLERSRQKIVAAREEARRRMGSNLHDGLGHLLASALRKVENAERLIEGDPVAAHNSLLETKQQMRTAIESTRSLAHSLHPPELELLGLVKALHEQCQHYNSEHALYITVDIPPVLPPLPIAVESAAYYIALEALHNIQRHAHARHATLSLRNFPGGESSIAGIWNTATVALEICDDDSGLREEAHRRVGGLGLTSMRERATELGGTCSIETQSTGGTCVYARLPYRQEDKQEVLEA